MRQSQTASFLPYAKQVIEEPDRQAVLRALDSGWITRGPEVEAFEQELAEYCGAQFAVAFNSGTSALWAACQAAEVGPYDRLLTSPNSFIATASCGLHCGATLVLVDIDPQTGNLSLEQLSHNLNQPNSRGRQVIVPVHYAGIPVDMQQLDLLIKTPDTVVIEDAAAALGSRYADGQKVGCCAHSHMTMFSLHPAKNITMGEGGVITTNDEELAWRLRRARNSGIVRDTDRYQEEATGPWYYEIQELTGNYNVTEMQAALGRAQLERIESFREQRQQILSWYKEGLHDCPTVRPLEALFADGVFPGLFVVRLADELELSRSAIMEALQQKGIGSQVHYLPMYRHPMIREQCGELTEYFPNAEEFYQRVLSLPLFVGLTQSEVNRVVEAISQLK